MGKSKSVISRQQDHELREIRRKRAKSIAMDGRDRKVRTHSLYLFVPQEKCETYHDLGFQRKVDRC